MAVYALDGRCEIIPKSAFTSWIASGWYENPMMKIYDIAGSSCIIPKSEFAYWSASGWYSEPVMTVYASDGRRQVVKKSEAPLWKASGWDWQTSYADNIPFENDMQVWAIIDLKEGPYDDWHLNRNYYIDKYFIEMPQSDRDNIKNYCPYETYASYVYLIIPRYKTANTAMSITFGEGDIIGTVENGTPFTLEMQIPASAYIPVFKIKTYTNWDKEFTVGQNMSGIPGIHLENEAVLDLTEYDTDLY